MDEFQRDHIGEALVQMGVVLCSMSPLPLVPLLDGSTPSFGTLLAAYAVTASSLLCFCGYRLVLRCRSTNPVYHFLYHSSFSGKARLRPPTRGTLLAYGAIIFIPFFNFGVLVTGALLLCGKLVVGYFRSTAHSKLKRFFSSELRCS